MKTVNSLLLSATKLNVEVLTRLTDALNTVLESPDVVRTLYRQDLAGEFQLITNLLTRDCIHALSLSDDAIAAAAAATAAATTTTQTPPTRSQDLHTQTTTTSAAAPVLESVAPVQQALAFA